MRLSKTGILFATALLLSPAFSLYQTTIVSGMPGLIGSTGIQVQAAKSDNFGQSLVYLRTSPLADRPWQIIERVMLGKNVPTSIVPSSLTHFSLTRAFALFVLGVGALVFTRQVRRRADVSL